MFFETFQITLSATLQVFLLAVAGYFTVRFKALDDKGIDQLTTILVNLFLPCFTFIQLSQHFNFRDYPFWWHLPVLYLGMAFAALALAYLTGFRFKGRRKNEFLALVGFQNCGNIPLVVVAALFTGATAHILFVYIVLFIIGANILIWTLGVWLLVSGDPSSPEGFARPSLKKMINPPIVVTLLTMGLVAIGGEHFIPQTLVKPVEMLGNCALPIAMFTVGGSMACINIQRIQIVPASLLILTKLILFPLLALAFVFSFKINPVMGFLIVLEAAVPSAITLSLINRYYGVKEEFTNEGVFVTHVASVITVPLFLALYLKLAGR